ncbi:hypothetical protein SISNIDRAFT_44753 [Sistotremastrum niveocremeum HHB9708]|uniref:Uncharacterized protein n=1 Tax=Sistotremastrum niveocremeum HHB9708 TaxID=1314777 RepID=A0A164VU07_9AGAM|nr:hypothetical protein SISNIDRAFT_44753 [Sistotremastrum niveocremeum HHB9708]
MDVDRERERQPHHANLINGNVHLFPSKTPPPPLPSRPHSQSLPHIAPAPPPEPSGVRQLQPQPTHSSHRRRTPVVPGTPNPPPPPPVLHLGTFVHPSSPFPLISCPPIPPCVSAPQNRSSDPPSTSSFTLLIPANFLPTSNPPPNQLKLWGGFPIYTQAPSPLYPPPLPRRIYTDDSDPVLCAIHSGLVTLTDCRRQLKDLKLHVGIVYQSDLGAKVWKGCYGEQPLETGRSGKGAAPLLRSYDWGSSHDGGGLEILRAEWVEVRILGFLLDRRIWNVNLPLVLI